jgi:hypothetical protein
LLKDKGQQNKFVLQWLESKKRFCNRNEDPYLLKRIDRKPIIASIEMARSHATLNNGIFFFATQFEVLDRSK